MTVGARDEHWTEPRLWRILLVLDRTRTVNCFINLGSGLGLDWVNGKVSHNFCCWKLYFVKFFAFIWTSNLKNFLDYGWTWTEFKKSRIGSGAQIMTVRSLWSVQGNMSRGRWRRCDHSVVAVDTVHEFRWNRIKAARHTSARKLTMFLHHADGVNVCKVYAQTESTFGLTASRRRKRTAGWFLSKFLHRLNEALNRFSSVVLSLTLRFSESETQLYRRHVGHSQLSVEDGIPGFKEESNRAAANIHRWFKSNNKKKTTKKKKQVQRGHVLLTQSQKKRLDDRVFWTRVGQGGKLTQK